MYIDATFVFSHEVPSRITIVKKVEEISGLGDLYLTSFEDEFWSVEHPEFTARRFVLFNEGNGITLAWGWPEKWYLLDVTAAALISLGGSYNECEIKPAFSKWAEVMDNYPVVRQGPLSEDSLQ